MPNDRSPDAASVVRTELRVDLLGPLRLRVDGRDVPVPGSRRRALLAVLALAGGAVVGADRLVAALWPDDPPENSVQALYNQVSRLRRHLEPYADRLERSAGGYRLRLEPEALDVAAARRLAREAAARGAGPQRTAELVRTALALWRGPALEEFRSWPELEVEAVGLDELHRRLVDDLLDARLTLGEPDVAADAARARAADPLRERTALLHVRALGSAGRQAEAMAAAQEFRHRLADETGLDPTPALRALEQQVAAGVLAGTAADATGPPSRTARPVRRAARPDGPLVGRQHDRSEVVRLLSGHGVVTLTGPGGVGKTSLALDVAGDPATAAATEVAVVDLAAVDSPDRVCQAVVSTLGLRITGEVGPEQVADLLSNRLMLLVLDNCEHVPDACRALVATLRRAAPGVRVLATSRVTLHVPGEYVVRLQPLPVPPTSSDLEAFRRQPAVRAFAEHARRLRSDFHVTPEDADDLAEVLRRLDGLPLGIELAARQVAVMPLGAVRQRLDRALDLATGRGDGTDSRQRTLRATIDSSYRLLTAEEQRLLRAFAPFPGGLDVATVEALAARLGVAQDPVDVLHRLVDASLVVSDPATGRCRLLFTVRTFLLDELRDGGELPAAESLFLDTALRLAEEIGVELLGPGERTADRRLRAELDNLRAARDVAVEHGRDDVRVGITVALDEGSIWRDLRELWTWALELAADPDLVGHPRRAAVLGAAAEAARLIGDLDRAAALAHEAMRVAGPDPDPALVQGAWRALGSVAHFRGDFAAAVDGWLRSGKGRRVESGAYVASAALATAYGGDPAGARKLLDRAQVAISRSGCRSHAAFATYVEAEMAAATDPRTAVPLYLRAIEDARDAGTTFVEGVASVGLASARTRLGDLAAAADGFRYLLDFWRRTDQPTQLWTTARNAAGLLAETGRTRVAALALLVAAAQPAAAAVGPAIARNSGRTDVHPEGIVPPDVLADLREEARRLGVTGTLDALSGELAAVARGWAAEPR